MSRVHVVEKYHSHAMLRMAAPLLDHITAATTGETPDDEADLNYHVPWHSLIGLPPTKSKQGMLYTHLNPPAKNELLSACQRADFIVAMSKTGATELLDLGIEPEKITVIYAGHEDIPFRRRNVGIIGFEQPNGRKRGHILIDLCWLMDVSPFRFVFCGGGWDDTINKMASAGASVANLGEVDESKLAELYGALDLLLVTSYVEGGPLTVLEALSAGVPVIAPPVGYANDLLPEDCIYYTLEGLQSALENFAAPFLQRREQVEKYTWRRYAEKHAELFERVLCQPTSTPIETATSALLYTE